MIWARSSVIAACMHRRTKINQSDHSAVTIGLHPDRQAVAGEVTEWLKVPRLQARCAGNRTGGSNPFPLRQIFS